MFVGLSKTFARFGKIRIGAGMRITKSNAVWMLFIMMLVWIFQLTWYMIVLCFWLVYAVVYGTIWGIKKLFKAIFGIKKEAAR